MQIVDKFIGYVKSEAIHHPEKSWNKILFGFQANKWRMKLLPNKNMAKGYQKLEHDDEPGVRFAVSEGAVCVGEYLCPLRADTVF